MPSGRPSRSGDVRLAHGARVDSVRVLACCTLRTISSAHQGAQGRSGRARREALAGSRGQQQQQQQPIRPLAPRDARRVEPASSTPCDAHLARSPRNPSTRRFFGRHRRAAPVSRHHDQSTARPRVSNALSLTHSWLPPRARRLLASLPARLSRPAQPCELPLSHACGHPRACAAAKQALLSTTLPDSGLLPGSLCIPSTPVPHLTEVKGFRGRRGAINLADLAGAQEGASVHADRRDATASSSPASSSGVPR